MRPTNRRQPSEMWRQSIQVEPLKPRSGSKKKFSHNEGEHMNILSNIGIFLAGVGFLLWGVSNCLDASIALNSYYWEQSIIEQDIRRQSY